MNLPLSDYTVLDLTIARAGPAAVRLLSDWGANVIRVEAPAASGAGDVTGDRLSPDSQNLHRNKRSISIDLKSEAGRLLFLEMATKADIVVENFRRDVKFRLGVDYESIRAVNPAIIYASVSGFGQDGPYSERPGVDQVVQGMSGLMSITGEPDQGPMRTGIAISDTSAGMFLGQGILMALLHREKTGEGQWVYTSLLESMLSKLDFQGARYTMAGDIPRQEGNHHPTNSPMGVFHTKDGLVNLAASTGKMFSALAAAIGQPELADDPRFARAKGRIKHRHELWEILNDITSKLTTEQLVTLANEAGCPCGPIYNIGEAFEDEHVKHLNMTRIARHAEAGDLSLVRSPINLSAFEHGEAFDRAGPSLGEHTDEILSEFGYSAEAIQALKDQGAI